MIDTVIGGVYTAIYQRCAVGRAAELPKLLPSLAYYVLTPFGLAVPPKSAPAAASAVRYPRSPMSSMPLFLTPDEN